MGFSAFMFAKNTVRCVGLLELLGMVLFTLNSFTKESGEGVHGLLNFKFTKRKVRKAVGLIALVFFTFKSKRMGRSLELLAFEFTNSNGTNALVCAGM